MKPTRSNSVIDEVSALERGEYNDSQTVAKIDDAMPASRPSCVEFVLPFIVLCCGAALYLNVLPWKQVLPVEPHAHFQTVSYPIWFKDGLHDRLYCNATLIDSCGAASAIGVVAGSDAELCCEHIRAGHMPGHTIPDMALVGTSVFVPLLIFVMGSSHIHRLSGSGTTAAAATTTSRFSFSFSGAEMCGAAVGFALTWAAAFSVTEALKRTMGVPRPNYYSLSALLAHDARTGADTYAKYASEQWMNIPSGHSSMSMAACVYVALYCTAKVQAHASTRGAAATQALLFLSGCPVLVAVWVAATRVEDYWHSPPAVLFGMVVGVTCALIGWSASGSRYVAQRPHT
jgi:hypothetical protein